MTQEAQRIISEILKKLDEKTKTYQTPKIETPALRVQAISQDTRKTIDFLELGRWLNIIKHPCVIIILGNRGSGKSALGYKILEYLRWTAKIYVVGLPEKAQKLLPDWIGWVLSLKDVPPNSIVLIDEAYMMLHARASASQRAKEISNLINLSRQKEQTLIFVTQEARQIDKNIASSADIIIVKNPGILQLEFERYQFKRIFAEAQRQFVGIDKDKHRWSYVYAPGSNFTGMLENSLPTFWTQGLSKAYADAKPAIEVKTPTKMTKEDKVKMARELRDKGYSLGEIKKILGVSKSTVKNYLDGYPYRRKRKIQSIRYVSK